MACPWAIALASLHLSFLICEVGLITLRRTAPPFGRKSSACLRIAWGLGRTANMPRTSLHMQTWDAVTRVTHDKKAVTHCWPQTCVACSLASIFPRPASAFLSLGATPYSSDASPSKLRDMSFCVFNSKPLSDTDSLWEEGRKVTSLLSAQQVGQAHVDPTSPPPTTTRAPAALGMF